MITQKSMKARIQRKNKETLEALQAIQEQIKIINKNRCYLLMSKVPDLATTRFVNLTENLLSAAIYSFKD